MKTTVFRLAGMGVGVSIVSELATHLRVTPSPAFVSIERPRASSPVVTVAAPKVSLSPATRAFDDLLVTWKR